MMASTCSYCGSSLEDGASKCDSCGAPITRDASSAPDFRRCPYCRRKLLALASPACSYCGRRLPEDYIKAREADLRRIAEIAGEDVASGATEKMDELIRQSVRQTREESLLDDLLS
jgi:DNA-directed RNA polymerase subunit RPC12/RpoP